MLKIFFFGLLNFCCLFAFAQTNNIKYIGVIRVDNIGPFAYEISISTDGDKITGSSITNTGKNSETKANLTGEVLKNGKEIRFSENRILETDLKDKKTTFCFVNAVLTKSVRGKMEILEGKFTGKDEKGGPCATGKIYLVRKSAIMADTTSMSQLIKKVADTLDKINKNLSTVTELSLSETNKIVCVGKKIRVRFYDGNVEDNDEIDIVYNEKSIIEKYVITRTGKTYYFDVDENKDNLLVINTHNVGYSGLNTVSIDVEIAPKQIKTYMFEAPARKTIKIKLSN